MHFEEKSEALAVLRAAISFATVRFFLSFELELELGSSSSV
jgi:hypothetical protein